MSDALAIQPLARRALPQTCDPSERAPRVACPAHSCRIGGLCRSGRPRRLLRHEEEERGRRRRPRAGRRGPEQDLKRKASAPLSARTGPRSSGAKTAPSPRARRCGAGGTRYACTRTRVTGKGGSTVGLGAKEPSKTRACMCGCRVGGAVGGRGLLFYRGRTPFFLEIPGRSFQPAPVTPPAAARTPAGTRHPAPPRACGGTYAICARPENVRHRDQIYQTIFKLSLQRSEFICPGLFFFLHTWGVHIEDGYVRTPN